MKTDAARQPRQPQRMCAACRRHEGKRGLIRLVRQADGRVTVDERGKSAGRGVYLCPVQECWEVALQRRVLERALRIDRLLDGDRAALSAYARQFSVSTEEPG